jgi:hypothetical protein
MPKQATEPPAPTTPPVQVAGSAAGAAAGGAAKAAKLSSKGIIALVAVVVVVAIAGFAFVTQGKSSSAEFGTADKVVEQIQGILNEDMNAMIEADDPSDAAATMAMDLFDQLPADVRNGALEAQNINESQMRQKNADYLKKAGLNENAAQVLKSYKSINVELSLGKELSASRIASMEEMLDDIEAPMSIDRGYELYMNATYADGTSNSDSTGLYAIKSGDTWYFMVDEDALESLYSQGVIAVIF